MMLTLLNYKIKLIVTLLNYQFKKHIVHWFTDYEIDTFVTLFENNTDLPNLNFFTFPLYIKETFIKVIY